MAKIEVTRLDRRRLERLVREFGNEDTPTAYTDRQLLVRELFWRRLGAMLGFARARRRGRVLDFGGGNGVLLPTLSKLYDEVVCVDPRAEMATVVAGEDRLANVSVHSAELRSLGLPAGSFDTVVAADVLEHLLDLEDEIREFERVLAPGGELVVSLPSENRFYAFGRAVFGYSKPHDHYHRAEDVEATIARVLRPDGRCHWPFDLGALGVFLLARFVKPPAQRGAAEG